MELQNALIIAGVVILLLLIAYNRWQIYKARRVRPLMPEDELPPMREPVVSKHVRPETAEKLQNPPPDQVQRREPTLGHLARACSKPMKRWRRLRRVPPSPTVPMPTRPWPMRSPWPPPRRVRRTRAVPRVGRRMAHRMALRTA